MKALFGALFMAEMIAGPQILRWIAQFPTEQRALLLFVAWSFGILMVCGMLHKEENQW